MDQSKCIFKVVVGVFDVERKWHGVNGMPQLSYITIACLSTKPPKRKMCFGLLFLHLKMISMKGRGGAEGGGRHHMCS